MLERRDKVLFTSRLLLLSGVIFATVAQAQTLRSAEEYMKRGDARYDRGDMDGAIADFTMAIEMVSRLAPMRRKIGNAWKEEEAMRDAAGFSNARVIDPRAAAVYINRASARYAKGDAEGALADLDQAISIRPRLAIAFYNRGTIYANQEKAKAALADFDQAIKLDPRMANAYHNRGNLKYLSKNLDGALADYN